MKTTIEKAGKWLALPFLLLTAGSVLSQQVYDDFDGNTAVNYEMKKKQPERVENPLKDSVNGSNYCARYNRGKGRWDNFKLFPAGKPENVQAYATYEGIPPKIKMKVYTTAPVGTMVEIQLGKKGLNAFPEGTHSQYQAYTTVSGAWEELEFKFAQIPKGSQTGPDQIDQVTILFSPNSAARVTFYFDDLMGPEIKAVQVKADGNGSR